MVELKITATDNWSYQFGVSICTDIPDYGKRCPHCGDVNLDNIYVYIITRLKEAGLLDENYGLICCYCIILKNLGMMQHCRNMEGIYYLPDKDILEIQIYDRERMKGGNNHYIIPFRIHDWSRVGRR